MPAPYSSNPRKLMDLRGEEAKEEGNKTSECLCLRLPSLHPAFHANLFLTIMLNVYYITISSLGCCVDKKMYSSYPNKASGTL